jgi:CRP/FNR family transcriptional regulator
MYEDLKYWYLRDHKLFRTLSFGQQTIVYYYWFKKAQKAKLFIFLHQICQEFFA